MLYYYSGYGIWFFKDPYPGNQEMKAKIAESIKNLDDPGVWKKMEFYSKQEYQEGVFRISEGAATKIHYTGKATVDRLYYVEHPHAPLLSPWVDIRIKGHPSPGVFLLYDDQGMPLKIEVLRKDLIEEPTPSKANSRDSTSSNQDQIIYDCYKNSLDKWKKESGIDLDALTKQMIFEQVRQTDKKLWNISLSTFRRDIWPRYSKENDLKKRPGRPRTQKNTGG